jgi:hypothetical protein
LGFLEYIHPVFELFKRPRSGDFSGARFFRYRPLEGRPSDQILARFDDGAVAAVERKVGIGRLIVWTSTLDGSWNDLPLKPVFLPLMQQITRYLARYEERPAWYPAEHVLDVSGWAATVANESRGLAQSVAASTVMIPRIVLAPSGQRVELGTAGSQSGLLELSEQGFYEIRTAGAREARPPAVAVDLDSSESDLSSMDPQELVGAVTGHATPPAASSLTSELSPQDIERRQAVWWYLLLAGMMMLVAENVLANRLSQVPTAVARREAPTVESVKV